MAYIQCARVDLYRSKGHWHYCTTLTHCYKHVSRKQDMGRVTSELIVDAKYDILQEPARCGLVSN